MGFYVQGPVHGKVKFIEQNYSGILATREEAASVVSSKGVIVVVNNGPFEAAAFAFNKNEFDDFHGPTDYRPKQYVIIDRKKACALTGFQE